MTTVVRKFGGTSMGTVENIRVVADIIRKKRSSQVVVVSAMSGVTNDLLDLVKATAKGSQAGVRRALIHIMKQHKDAVFDLVADVQLRADTISYIDQEMSHLAGVLETIDSPEPPATVLDSILAVGEELSSRLLAAHLSDSGTPAMQVDLKTSIPATFQAADGHFYAAAEKIFGKEVRTVLRKKKIPVVTGYFGRVPGGMSKSVGRGYSDFCAALIAAGVKATELEIWTDVSGVYSADPRKVKKAEIIDRMTFESAAEMAHFGAKVIHPQCIHPAVRVNIPVRIKNTFDPKAPGTRIIRNVPRHRRPVAAVTAKRPITMLHIVSLRKLVQHGFLAKLFEILAAHDVPVDVVSTSEVSVSLACDRAVPKRTVAALQRELLHIARVTVADKQAIICVVGGGMIGKRGIAGELFSVVGKAQINIRQISQGASERNITFVVDEKDAEKAVLVIHKHFVEA